jgi:ligand-binding sensor domain-containing protein
MKYTARLTLGFLLTCVALPNLYGQWVQTNGPSNRVVSFFYVAGATVYASTDSGSIRSTDNGATWSYPPLGWPNDVAAFAVSGSYMYAGGGNSTIGVSTDCGATWGVDTSLHYSPTAFAIFDSNIFAGTAEGIFRSSNGAFRWQAVNSGLTDLNILCLAVNGSTLFAGTDGGIYSSTNNGTSWNLASTGLGNSVINVFAFSGGNVFAGTDGGVYLSTNNGATWAYASTGLAFGVVNSIAVSGGNIFTDVYGAGVYLSTNGGALWSPIDSGLTNLDVNAVAISGSKLLAGTPAGAFISTNNGTSWSTLRIGNPGTWIQAIAVTDTSVFASAEPGLWISTDNGADWIDREAGLGYSNVRALAFCGSSLIAGNGIPFISTNNGVSWTQSSTGMTSLTGGVNALTVNGSAIYAGTEDSGVYVSNDSGANWHSINTGLSVDYVFSMAALGSKIFAGTDQGVYRTTNAGANWNAVNIGLPHGAVWAFAEIGPVIFAGFLYDGLFLSTDSGSTWRSSDSGAIPYVNALATSGTNLFAATGTAVYLSTDYGTTWSNVSAGLPGVSVNVLACNATSIFAGTARDGVWKRPLSELETAVRASKSSIPQSFKLEQNYPNPFNPTTTIRYELPKSAFVHLTVFNLLGQAVRTLVNETEQAGYKSVSFNAGNLVSGMYFYRIQAGNFTDVKKMVLVK